MSSTGATRLVDVPASYYTVQSTVYGTIAAKEIVLNRALSQIPDEGWQDDLYVTYRSSVGPNIAGILRYIVEHYTDLACDEATFAYVETKLARFPANFPINDCRNVLAVLQEIAFQCRSALWVSSGTVYLKYLPEEPTPVDAITVSDIDAEQGVEVELTATEDVVTKINANWHLRWATSASRPVSTTAWGRQAVVTQTYDAGNTKENAATVTLRHNIKKYGVHERTYDFYIFNQPDIVYKMATFWLIRKSNTWKRIKFTTPLHKLNLETFDAVTLDFSQGYVASGPVTAIIESAKYDSANNCIHFQCLTPVAAGTREKNDYFWPADLPKTATWPPEADIRSGNAGGYSGATGTLPVGDTSTIESLLFIGGPNVVYGPNSDYGDPTPTDLDFTAKDTVLDVQYATSTTVRPTLNVAVDYAEKTPPLETTFTDASIAIAKSNTLDIHSTFITDGVNKALLSTVFKAVAQGSSDAGYRVALDAMPLVSDGSNAAHFTYEFDEDTEQFGAKIAFLEDS